jgi:hypothetical protein
MMTRYSVYVNRQSHEETLEDRRTFELYAIFWPRFSGYKVGSLGNYWEIKYSTKAR